MLNQSDRPTQNDQSTATNWHIGRPTQNGRPIQRSHISMFRPYARLPRRSWQVLLRFEILEIWPQCNESNVRVFVSMLISFAIEQINQEIEDATASDESHQAFNEPHQASNEPQPHATLKSNDSPITAKNPKLAGLSKFPVTLKAYTKALVSWDTITKGERVTIKGYIDYGPEALKTLYIIAETKMVGYEWPVLGTAFVVIWVCLSLICGRCITYDGKRNHTTK